MAGRKTGVPPNASCGALGFARPISTSCPSRSPRRLDAGVAKRPDGDEAAWPAEIADLRVKRRDGATNRDE
jgi:hypothetical protein